MKRIFSALVVALTILAPASAFASTVNLSPTTVSVTPGKVFTVTVTADPAGTKLYTVRANLAFDPALVKVTNFTFAPKWLALSTSGYDSTDNTNGTLVKTAGYPGGITAPTVFGTVTFEAKAAGTAHVDVTTKSLTLDQNSKNTLSGTQGAATVAIAAPKPQQKPQPKPAPKQTPEQSISQAAKSLTAQTALAATTSATSTATTTEATSTATTSPLSQTAAAGASGAGSSTMLYVFLALAAVVLGVLAANRKRLFQRRQG